MKNRHDFQDHWPAPNEYLLELGRMTSIWGILESLVTVAISKLAGFQSTSVDDRALIMVVHSSFPQKINIISSLCDWLLPEFPNLQNYKAVILKLEEAQKIRNKFAHNAITLNEGSSDVTLGRATARGTLKTASEVVKLEDIKEATAKIHEAMCSLQTLLTGKELKPIWERG